VENKETVKVVNIFRNATTCGNSWP